MSLPLTSPTPRYGVIFAPFQTAGILDEHISIVELSTRQHDITIIALPVRRVTPSKNSPLNFIARQRMIAEVYGDVIVVAVPDTKYPGDKVKALEAAVRAVFSEMRGKARLYTDPQFAELYKANGGKWELKEEDFLAVELKHRNDVKNKIGDYGVGLDYRLGVIQGLNTQFPISWSTVDICISRIRIDGAKYILLGKKPGEHGWRFPGGFKDRVDPNYETAVLREAGEEILQEGIDPNAVLKPPVYIGSMNVKDWRYADEIDGITTLFYGVEFCGTNEDIKAGDDLAEAEWFKLSEVTPEMMEGEHVHLYNMLMKSEAARA